MQKVLSLSKLSLIFTILFLGLVVTNKAYAQSAGSLEIIPENHALVGFGYGSDDKNCTLYWKEGRMYADGTIGEIDTNWHEKGCYYGNANHYGDDTIPSSARQKQAPSNEYLTAWSWDSDTDGGRKLGIPPNEYTDIDYPGNECFYQIYQQFDPNTKAFIGSPKAFGSPYDGSCNERQYEFAWLQRFAVANPGKVLVAVGLSLGGDGDVNYVSIASRKPPPAAPSCTTPGPGTNQMIGCKFYDVPYTEKLTYIGGNAPAGPSTGSPAPTSFTAIDQIFSGGLLDGYKDFSLRWQGTFNFSSGDYDFILENPDDGVRLYIDGALVTDKWVVQCCNNFTTRRSGFSGSHTIKLEYFNQGGPAQVKLRWQKVGDPPPPQPTPTLTFTASPPNITSPGQALLEWSSSNVTSCTASASPANSQWTGSKAVGPDKQQDVTNLTQTTTFYLECDGPYGKTPKREQTVTVSPPSPVEPYGFHDGVEADCSITWGWTCDSDDFATPLNVRFYTHDNNAWQFRGEMTADGNRPDVASSCGGNPNHGFIWTLPESLKDGFQHELSAWPCGIPDDPNIPGCDYSVNPLPIPKIITCGAPPPPPAVDISASPTTVPYNTASTLSWTSQSVVSCSASADPINTNWTGDKPISSSGYSTGPLTETTVFTITCLDAGNQPYTDRVTVTVGQPVANINLTASPQAITPGDTSTLNWDTSNIISGSCVASGGWSGTQSDSGSQGVGPLNVTTTFTLTCKDLNNQDVVKSVTVTVGSGTLGVTLFINAGGGWQEDTQAALPANNVDLRGDVSGTVLCPITYKFWCDASQTNPTITETSNLDPKDYIDLCDYTTQGIYTAKVTITRAGLDASDTGRITVARSCALGAAPNNRHFARLELVEPSFDLPGLIQSIILAIS